MVAYETRVATKEKSTAETRPAKCQGTLISWSLFQLSYATLRQPAVPGLRLAKRYRQGVVPQVRPARCALGQSLW